MAHISSTKQVRMTNQRRSIFNQIDAANRKQQAIIEQMQTGDIVTKSDVRLPAQPPANKHVMMPPKTPRKGSLLGAISQAENQQKARISESGVE